MCSWTRLFRAPASSTDSSNSVVGDLVAGGVVRIYHGVVGQTHGGTGGQVIVVTDGAMVALVTLTGMGSKCSP